MDPDIDREGLENSGKKKYQTMLDGKVQII